MRMRVDPAGHDIAAGCIKLGPAAERLPCAPEALAASFSSLGDYSARWQERDYRPLLPNMRADLAVFRPSSSTWYTVDASAWSMPFGGPGDVPIAARSLPF